MNNKHFPIYAGTAIGLIILGLCIFWGMSIHRIADALTR